EGRVPDPGVAIVPVAPTADVLWQAEGGRGDDRAVLRGGEQLQRERGAVDHLAPAALIRAARDPPPPEVDGLLEGVALVIRAFARRFRRRRYHLEHEPRRFVGPERELRDHGVSREPQRDGRP